MRAHVNMMLSYEDVIVRTMDMELDSIALVHVGTLMHLAGVSVPFVVERREVFYTEAGHVHCVNFYGHQVIR